MEFGIGIHGEPGRRRAKTRSRRTRSSAAGGCGGAAILPFQSGDSVALMINGLGGTPHRRTVPALRLRARTARRPRASRCRRSYVGEYCTSLEMAGASLTLVKLDPELSHLLEAPAEIALRIF